RESVEIENQIETVREQRSGIEKELMLSENSEKEINERTVALEAEFQRVSAARQVQSGKVENIHLSVGSLQQQSGFLYTNMERLSREIEALIAEDKNIDEALSAGEGEAEEKRQNIAAIEETIKAGAEAAEKENAELTEVNAKKSALQGRRKNLFNSRDELSTTLSRLDKESFRLHERMTHIEESIESQASYLWEEYELTPSEAKKLRDAEMTDRKAIKQQITKLKDEIKKLGHVNVNAIEDYKNLVERHTFLDGQHRDLVESEKTLEGIIAELDKGMRRQFNEKFAEIAREFDKTFKLLFGGGRGTLKIDETVDVLEAAITIDAEPPGKKLQNMMQLSGGEKALTAIALLFAIQGLKPSPFCLLDEIEAALDDNNVSRFAEYLHKLTANTQFIVITHRRGTMASCDRLYGITMQEKGISTLVSVNLIEEKLDA
ncbi:MAG: AAA family ATPase, partial [Lachnospiraceae bacterium]|nr:AAA family ATPase [Lachnospiraceae bacterium]